MESYTSSPSELGCSQKQLELIGVFQQLIAANGIEFAINSKEWLIRSPFSLDVEHDEAGNLVGIGLCKDTLCLYFTTISPFLRDAIEKSEIIAHNGLSDFECLRQWGINVRDEQLVHDTMLVGHVLDSSLKSYGLKDMSKRELGIVYPSYDDIVGRRTTKQTTARLTLDKQPLELVAMYNSCDTYCTYKLYEKQKGQI